VGGATWSLDVALTVRVPSFTVGSKRASVIVISSVTFAANRANPPTAFVCSTHTPAGIVAGWICPQ
jgi:hypothetical protein